MLKIKLTQDAYVSSGEYRLHTDAGKPSITVLTTWYEALASDNEGNEYRVFWEISNQEAFDSGNEDCCDWNNPIEIYSYKDQKPVKAEIEW